MKSWHVMVLGGLLALVAAALILAAPSFADDADDPGTRGAPYLTADACQPCHPSTYDGWNTTGHAGAWDALIADPNYTAACDGCHTTGFGQTGGFVDIGSTPEMVDVQCEECHGPGTDHLAAPPSQKSATIVVDLSSELCGQCHQGEHHPFYNEWALSGHAEALESLRGALNAEDSCMECHAADYILAPDPSLRPTIETAQDGVTCMVCHDPHGTEHGRELRMPREQLCNSCHNPGTSIPGDPIFHPQSSMRAGFSSAPVDSDQFMPTVDCEDCHMYAYPYDPGRIPPQITGHSFRQKPEACADCHDGTQSFVLSVEESGALIDKWQGETVPLLQQAEYQIALAEVALKRAPEYGFGNTTIQNARAIFDEANYSKNFVAADGSMGAHNPDYTKNLLLHARAQAREVVAMLTPGTVTGLIVDQNGAPLAGVDIRSDGTVWATTDSGGTFSFRYAQGTHAFGVYRGDERLGDFGGVVVVPDEVANVGTVSVTVPGEIPILYYVLVVVLIAAMLALLYLAYRRRLGGGTEEE